MTGARAELVVDLDAVRANVGVLVERCAPAAVMVVVKADGYGHGALPVARAARAGGATWLGVAFLEEALALREAGDTGRVLTWLTVPGEDHAPAVDAGIDVTAYTVTEVHAVAAAARRVGRPARLQLKVDTGLSRGGATAADWPAVVAAAATAEEAGDVRVTGVWSHLACSDEPEHPANDEQEQAFRAALAVAGAGGLTPEVRHLANSAAALTRPSARFDLVRCGLAAYGLSPAPEVASAAELGLVPAMTARARLAVVKQVPAGAGVSYGHTYRTTAPSTLAVVPVGYGEGVPVAASSRAPVLVGGRRVPVAGRVCMDQFVVDLHDQPASAGDEVVPVGYGEGVPVAASSRAPVLVGGRRVPVAGRVCMDQFVVDLHDQPASAGDEVVLFGPGLAAEPTAQEWAEACGTISYEIVTRIGGRFVRRYVGEGSNA